jgi:probable O-glycosylation ligase (exosortase A-associated)
MLGAVVIFVATVGLLAFMPASWEERMQTIGSYQQDGSAMGRITAWELAFRVANDRLTGAGFLIEKADIYARYGMDTNLVLTAHSIYFQALGEQGWIGLALFLGMGALSFLYASRMRKTALERPETEWIHDLAGMVQVSMVGYAVGGAFLSLTYLDLPYNLMVMLLACKYWLREDRWHTEKIGAFGATSGSRRVALATAAKPLPARP